MRLADSVLLGGGKTRALTWSASRRGDVFPYTMWSVTTQKCFVDLSLCKRKEKMGSFLCCEENKKDEVDLSQRIA